MFWLFFPLMFHPSPKTRGLSNRKHDRCFDECRHPPLAPSHRLARTAGEGAALQAGLAAVVFLAAWEGAGPRPAPAKLAGGRSGGPPWARRPGVASLMALAPGVALRPGPEEEEEGWGEEAAQQLEALLRVVQALARHRPGWAGIGRVSMVTVARDGGQARNPITYGWVHLTTTSPGGLPCLIGSHISTCCLVMLCSQKEHLDGRKFYVLILISSKCHLVCHQTTLHQTSLSGVDACPCQLGCQLPIWIALNFFLILPEAWKATFFGLGRPSVRVSSTLSAVQRACVHRHEGGTAHPGRPAMHPGRRPPQRVFPFFSTTHVLLFGSGVTLDAFCVLRVCPGC